MDSLYKKLESTKGEELVDVQLQVASRMLQFDPIGADRLVNWQ